MLETSVAGRTPADYGITLPRPKVRYEDAIDLRDRELTIELWLLAALFGSVLALVFAFAQQRNPLPSSLVGSASMTPLSSAPQAPLLQQAEFSPEVIASKIATGQLKVSAPDGARIWVDGRRVRRMPVKVTAGEHRVRVSHGGISFSDIAEVPIGETIDYKVAFNFSTAQ